MTTWKKSIALGTAAFLLGGSAVYAASPRDTDGRKCERGERAGRADAPAAHGGGDQRTAARRCRVHGAPLDAYLGGVPCALLSGLQCGAHGDRPCAGESRSPQRQASRHRP